MPYKDPQKKKEWSGTYYSENREKICKYSRKYRAEHLEKVRSGIRGYNARRRKTDPAFHLLLNLRSRMGGALKRGWKSGRTVDLLGCSTEKLRAHLEAQFCPGMTWENYGPVWHVDHKRPCASFDLLDPAQQRKCFHYTNLQPLFAEENLKKNAFYAWD